MRIQLYVHAQVLIVIYVYGRTNESINKSANQQSIDQSVSQLADQSMDEFYMWMVWLEQALHIITWQIT